LGGMRKRRNRIEKANHVKPIEKVGTSDAWHHGRWWYDDTTTFWFTSFISLRARVSTGNLISRRQSWYSWKNECYLLDKLSW
jgi:hypothetical protein